MPSTLSGMAIAVPLHLDKDIDGVCIFTVEMTRVYIMLFLGYGLSAFLILAIWEVDAEYFEEEPECKASLVRAQMACVFIFMASIFCELLESGDMFLMLYHAEGSTDGRSLLRATECQHGAVVVEEKPKGLLSYCKHKITPVLNSPPDMPKWSWKHVNQSYKMWCFAIVWLPKLLLTLSTGFFGGLYITHCTTLEDLVLNSLAVNFILEMENILYGCFIAAGTKHAIETMETVEVEMTDSQRIRGWFCSSVLYPVFTFLATFYIVCVANPCGLESLPPSLQAVAVSLHQKLERPMGTYD